MLLPPMLTACTLQSAGHGREGAEEKQKTSVDGEKATPRQKAERSVIIITFSKK